MNYTCFHSFSRRKLVDGEAILKCQILRFTCRKQQVGEVLPTPYLNHPPQGASFTIDLGLDLTRPVVPDLKIGEKVEGETLIIGADRR